MRRLLTYFDKVRLTLLLVASLFLLQACGDSILSTEPPQLDPAPSALTAACPRPVVLPDRSLSQAEVEAFWLRDRQRLVECGLTKQAVVDFYRNRDALIMGVGDRYREVWGPI